MNRPFAESFLNRADHCVLRQKLRPLSLWHLLNLEIAASPYFIGGRLPLVRDLRIAITICTTHFPRLPDFTLPRLVCGWLRSWRCNFLTETAKFRAYLEDFNALPQLWKKPEVRPPEDRPTVGLPWPLAIVSSVCRSTGWSAESVWNMPVGQAYWYHVAFAIQKGCSMDLLSEGEMEAIERVKAKKARQ